MDHKQYQRMLNAMDTYGGGFVQSLASTFRCADSENTTRLLNSFPEYVHQYSSMAEIEHEKFEGLRGPKTIL